MEFKFKKFKEVHIGRKIKHDSKAKQLSSESASPEDLRKKVYQLIEKGDSELNIIQAALEVSNVKKMHTGESENVKFWTEIEQLFLRLHQHNLNEDLDYKVQLQCLNNYFQLALNMQQQKNALQFGTADSMEVFSLMKRAFLRLPPLQGQEQASVYLNILHCFLLNDAYFKSFDLLCFRKLVDFFVKRSDELNLFSFKKFAFLLGRITKQFFEKEDIKPLLSAIENKLFSELDHYEFTDIIPLARGFSRSFGSVNLHLSKLDNALSIVLQKSVTKVISPELSSPSKDSVHFDSFLLLYEGFLILNNHSPLSASPGLSASFSLVHAALLKFQHQFTARHASKAVVLTTFWKYRCEDPQFLEMLLDLVRLHSKQFDVRTAFQLHKFMELQGVAQMQDMLQMGQEEALLAKEIRLSAREDQGIDLPQITRERIVKYVQSQQIYQVLNIAQILAASKIYYSSGNEEIWKLIGTRFLKDMQEVTPLKFQKFVLALAQANYQDDSLWEEVRAHIPRVAQKMDVRGIIDIRNVLAARQEQAGKGYLEQYRSLNHVQKQLVGALEQRAITLMFNFASNKAIRMTDQVTLGVRKAVLKH